MRNYEPVIDDILICARQLLTNLRPSEWAELNRIMTGDVSPIPGQFSYDNSAYTREIVDCASPNHPAKWIAIMKGAQIGFSTAVIENAIGWIMSQNPGPILFLVGHDDLVDEAIAKVDRMIDSCGIRHLIKPNSQRKKNMKTGDTNRKKEFPGGYLVSGVPNNHKLLRNRSIQYGFIDDFEAAKGSTAQSGSTSEMIEQRFSAYDKKMKLFYISTPELKQTSNIEPVFLLGDQRKYHVKCPCCKEYIYLSWKVQLEKNPKEFGGMTWQLDSEGKLITGSVEYICQKCGGHFDDKEKNDMVLNGHWEPTAEPSQVGYYSYHISSLYAPTYMYGWEHYARKYLEAHPQGEPRDEGKYKTFVNLCLGETYEATGETPVAKDLFKKQRKYEIGVIPEKLSEADGNGKIVLLTCACDLNGVPEDARLDYEILAWSESGSSYSISHGSIGTFIPFENSKKVKEDRARWTYEHKRPNSVWPEFDKIIGMDFKTDTGRTMKILLTGVDTGHYNLYAYPYVDDNKFWKVALKGKDKDKYIPFGKDLSSFKYGKERSNLFLVEVGLLKDELSGAMKLNWDASSGYSQPPGYLNYPQTFGDKYSYEGFFSHYEAEHRVIENKNGEGIAARWEKKGRTMQNHFWDVRVYNMVLRDIVIDYFVGKLLKIKNPTWGDYVDMLKGKLKP